MGSESSYILKVSGRVWGKPPENTDIIEMFHAIFPERAPAEAGEKGTWPTSFIWPDTPPDYDWPPYSVRVWDSRADEIYASNDPPTTRLSFRAQLAFIRPGVLYVSRKALMRETEWFYNYCVEAWYQDLKRMLRRFNEKAGPDRLRDYLDIYNWEWYSGNGGGE